jgi:hypothetical protein
MSGPGPFPRSKALTNAYVTTCKVCRAGVYVDQPSRWSTNPMGISHEACLTSAVRR